MDINASSGGGAEAFPFSEEAAQLLTEIRKWRAMVQDYALKNPAEALFWTLTGGAYLFYLAEKSENEEVKTYGDALHYISTCLSVGYARIFPVTQAGKLIASLVMAVGPALTSWLIEGRLVEIGAGGTPMEPARPGLDPALQRLDAILDELRALRAGGGGLTPPALQDKSG